MNIPENLLYTKEHEWCIINNKIATVGITDFAQSELGDIVFIEFPELNNNIYKDQPIGTIEAVKTVADIYTPISGKVIKINNSIEDSPELINTSPYDEGWILSIETDESINSSEYLSSSEYKKFLGL